MVANDFQRLQIFGELVRNVFRTKGIRVASGFVYNPRLCTGDLFSKGFGYAVQLGHAQPNGTYSDVKRLFELASQLGCLDDVSQVIQEERGIHLDTSQLLQVLTDKRYINGRRGRVKWGRSKCNFLSSRLFDAIQVHIKSDLRRCIRLSRKSHPLDKFVRSSDGVFFKSHDLGYAAEVSGGSQAIVPIDIFHNGFIDYVAANYRDRKFSSSVLKWFKSISSDASSLAQSKLNQFLSNHDVSEDTDYILCLKFFIDRQMFMQFCEYFYEDVHDKWAYGHYELKREIQFLTFPFKLQYKKAQRKFHHDFHFKHI